MGRFLKKSLWDSDVKLINFDITPDMDVGRSQSSSVTYKFKLLLIFASLERTINWFQNALRDVVFADIHKCQIAVLWFASPCEVSPVGDPACPPLSALALCRESAASVPARELLGGSESQSGKGREEKKVWLHKHKKKNIKSNEDNPEV